MDLARATVLACVVLILAKAAAQLWLEHLNRRSVLAHAAALPAAFQGIMDDAAYAKSVGYSLANGRLRQLESLCASAVLLAVLLSGLLPSAFGWFELVLGAAPWARAAFLCATGLALSLPGLPLDWYDQFRLEERFGFNTTTQKLWWLDRLKGLLLSLALGWPLLWLVLKLVEWTGPGWWWWAWGLLLGVQLLLAVLAPVLILPLFNRFTPLPEGTLRQRLLDLAQRTRFRARAIQVMDGSKRSRHSNAFFTGLGRFRKIVLFDTLLEQLAEPELEAVLAHEIGHFKQRHVPKTFALSTAGSLAGLYLVSLLARQDWFYHAFGFLPGSIVPALLLFALLSGVVTFWVSPVVHGWSRRHEYQADAFAAQVMRQAQPLIGALRKLNEKNLSNLTPHPLYSAFYYSHPTLLERERALLKTWP